MRTHDNQRVLPLRDVPDEVVTLCRSEAHAVRLSLEIARERGLDMQAVSLACGWKGKPACLSQIASEGTKRRMPPKKLDRFCKVTGCNLLRQYMRRQETLRQLTGKVTERERNASVVAMTLSAWRAAA